LVEFSREKMDGKNGQAKQNRPSHRRYFNTFLHNFDGEMDIATKASAESFVDVPTQEEWDSSASASRGWSVI
jgi:hypothetical protein